MPGRVHRRSRPGRWSRRSCTGSSPLRAPAARSRPRSAGLGDAHLLGERLWRVRHASVVGDPAVDRLTLCVAHQAHRVAGAGLLDQRGEPLDLGRVGLDVAHPDPLGARPQQRIEGVQVAAPEVELLVGDGQYVAVPGSDLAELLDQVVGTIADGTEPDEELGAGTAYA